MQTPNISLVFDGGSQAQNTAANLLCDAFQKNGAVAEVHDALSLEVKKLAKADAIVFGSPSSFGTVTANIKRFMEATEAAWYQQPWLDKFAAGFTTSSCHSIYKVSTLQTLELFAAYHGMQWVNLGILPRFIFGQQSEGQNRYSCYTGLALEYTATNESIEFHPGDLLTLELFAKRVTDIVTKNKTKYI